MILSVINNKGGTGKSTTSINLAGCLARKGYRVLLVDMDSQASASFALGITWQHQKPSLAEVLLEGASLRSTIRTTLVPQLYLVTGGMELAGFDVAFAEQQGRETIFKKALAGVRPYFDFIFLDCPPSLSLLPINALMASDGYLVPVTPEYLALEGLINLLQAVDRLYQGMDLNIQLLGIVLTLVDTRMKQSKKISNLIKDHYGELVFSTCIRRDAALSEAPAHSLDVHAYASRSRGARDYAKLTKELIQRGSVCEGNNDSSPSWIQGIRKIILGDKNLFSSTS
jgi:chromosome partitioning protein